MEHESLLDKPKSTGTVCTECCSRCTNRCNCRVDPCQQLRILALGGDDTGTQFEPFRCWVNLAATFILNAIGTICEATFGIYLPYIVDKFEASVASVSLISVLYISAINFSGIGAGPFLSVYGYRPVAVFGSCLYAAAACLGALAPSATWLVVLRGSVAGCGAGIVFISSMALIQQCFPYHRGLATGFAFLGYTLGTVIGPVIIQYLLEEWGLSGALLLHGLIVMQGIVCSMVLEDRKEFLEVLNKTSPRHTNDGSSTENEDRKVISGKLLRENEGATLRKKISLVVSEYKDFPFFRSTQYILIVFVKAFWKMSTYGLYTHTVNAALFRGIDGEAAAYLVVVCGIVTFVGRLISMFTLQMNLFHPVIDLFIGSALLAASSFVLVIARSYRDFFMAMVLMGASDGVVIAALHLVIVAIVGAEKYATGYALTCTVQIPLMFLGAPVAGWMKDVTGSYVTSFVMLGVTSSVSTLLVTIMYVLYKRRGTMRFQEDANSEGSGT